MEEDVLSAKHFANGINNPWHVGNGQQHAIMPTDSLKIIYKYYYKETAFACRCFIGCKPLILQLAGKLSIRLFNFFLYLDK